MESHGSNRAARRRANNQGATRPGAGEAAPFHVHANVKGSGGSVTIPIEAARILLDVCSLPAVAGALQASMDKLHVGYAQQQLEIALSAPPPATEEPPSEPADILPPSE